MHYSGAKCYLFVNRTKNYKFKAKDSKTVPAPLWLGSNSKDWPVDNLKRTGFYGYVYDFSISYDATDIDDILNIHNYLMKKKITV